MLYLVWWWPACPITLATLHKLLHQNMIDSAPILALSWSRDRQVWSWSMITYILAFVWEEDQEAVNHVYRGNIKQHSVKVIQEAEKNRTNSENGKKFITVHQLLHSIWSTDQDRIRPVDRRLLLWVAWWWSRIIRTAVSGCYKSFFHSTVYMFLAPGRLISAGDDKAPFRDFSVQLSSVSLKLKLNFLLHNGVYTLNTKSNNTSIKPHQHVLLLSEGVIGVNGITTARQVLFHE